jgi:hypothetical protein
MRDKILQAFGEVSAVFMSDPNGGSIVMPTERLIKIADRLAAELEADLTEGG